MLFPTTCILIQPKTINPKPVQSPSLKVCSQSSQKHHQIFLYVRPKFDLQWSFLNRWSISDFLELYRKDFLFSFLRFQLLVEFGLFHFGWIQNLISNPQRIFDQFGLAPNSVLFIFLNFRVQWMPIQFWTQLLNKDEFYFRWLQNSAFEIMKTA